MDDKQTLTIEETARALGIGRNTAYASARRGDIPTIRLGRRVVVPKAALERFLTQQPPKLALTAANQERQAVPEP